MAVLRDVTAASDGGRRRAVRALAGAAAALAAAAPIAALAQPALEYAVKANYLYKFGPFVGWPDGAFASARSPFKVCVLGEDPFGAALDEATRGQTVSGHPVIVRRLQVLSANPDCHVVYVGRSRSQKPADVLRMLRDQPVLTVTDEGQGVTGGIIHFVLRDGRVRFEIDTGAAHVSGLILSSKLVGLAAPPARARG